MNIWEYIELCRKHKETPWISKFAYEHYKELLVTDGKGNEALPVHSTTGTGRGSVQGADSGPEKGPEDNEHRTSEGNN